MITTSIVTYNHRLSDIRPLLLSLMASPIDKICIVDHSDRDFVLETELEEIRTLAFDSGIEIHYVRRRNDGYGAGHNVAIKEAIESGSEYHLVVNPDVWFGPEVIPTLKEYMDVHDDVGQIMPKVLYPDGKIQRVSKLLPTPLDMFGRLCLPRFLIRRRNDRFELKHLGCSRVLDVPYLSGCFMFFRVSAVREIGLFDERFFMYSEDIDITRRIHQAGYKTLFYPFCFIYHTFSRASRKSLHMLSVHIVNIVLYFNKWGWWKDEERTSINRETLEQ